MNTPVASGETSVNELAIGRFHRRAMKNNKSKTMHWVNGVKKMSCYKIKEKREGFFKFLVCALSQVYKVIKFARRMKRNQG